MNKSRLLLRCTCILAFLSCLHSGYSQNAVHIVTSLDDAGQGSLREAVTNSQDGDSIAFESNLSGTIALSGPITIQKNITIKGPGAENICIQTRYVRAFIIDGSAEATILDLSIGPIPAFINRGGIENHGSLFLSGCILSDVSWGAALDSTGAKGGAIYNSGTLVMMSCSLINNWATGIGIGVDGLGGGIFNQGTLTLSNCSFAGNLAIGSAGNPDHKPSQGLGGAVYNSGVLTATGCTFERNKATGGEFLPPSSLWGGSGGKGSGGGIYNASTAYLENCTFSANDAKGGNGYVPRYGGTGTGGTGGAIHNASTLTLINCTMARNSVGNGGLWGAAVGGGIVNTGEVKIQNSIVALNSGSNSVENRDVGGFFSSRGYNLISIADSSNGFRNQHNGDWVGNPSNVIDPMLDSLAFNGGKTRTIALLPGSPAIDHGMSLDAPLFDQRGFRRDATPDIGAFEYGAISSVDQETDVPVTTSLSQNFPNPFNPITKIRFSLSGPNHVTLKIYNIRGQEVATLVNGKLAARIYEVEWNANNMPSGVYLYRLQAGNFIETKKLVLLK